MAKHGDFDLLVAMFEPVGGEAVVFGAHYQGGWLAEVGLII